MPNIFLGGVKSAHAALGFFVVAIDFDQNLRRPAIFGQLDSGNADQADARITEFAFYERLDLLAQGFAQSSAMMLYRTLLHKSPWIKTHENIRKTGVCVVVTCVGLVHILPQT